MAVPTAARGIGVNIPKTVKLAGVGDESPRSFDLLPGLFKYFRNSHTIDLMCAPKRGFMSTTERNLNREDYYGKRLSKKLYHADAQECGDYCAKRRDYRPMD
jgi:hypothetical protein